MRARRSASAPSPSRWAATSASIVEVFPPNSTNLAGSPKRALKRIRPTGANGSLSVRNSTATDDFYLVQVSARRGWGAYRLHWSVGQ